VYLKDKYKEFFKVLSNYEGTNSLRTVFYLCLSLRLIKAYILGRYFAPSIETQAYLPAYAAAYLLRINEFYILFVLFYVSLTMSSLASDPILVSYHDSIVRSSNLKTLDNSNWLDDSIITFAFEYLQYDSKFTKNHDQIFAFVSPPVVQLLKMTDDSFAEQLLQSIEFTNKRFLFLPINDNKQVTVFGGTHWSLLILSIQSNTYDFIERKK